MIQLIPLILSVLCVCCYMISSGAVVLNRFNDPDRNLTIDYFLYISLCLGCCCILLIIVPPLFIGYSFFDFFGLIPSI